ncbi:MAG: NHLP bacteriocin system secretion protein, partial [Bacteroidota bacterium]
KDTSEIRAEASGRVLEITGILGQMVTQGARLGSIKLEDAEEENRLASVAYFTIGDGRRMRPGMKVQITPDTVKREEFGGILGTVTSVSEYPVTVEGVANIVNNPVMAASLSEGGRIIEVFFTLTPDPSTKSGFRWSSSRGPNLRILPGVTNVARVTVEQRAPISFVLPFLRSMLGG